MNQFTQHKYVILGGGPGGLQLAYYLEQANQDYIVLDSADIAGNTFAHFPRHRTLISINKRFTGSTDPEFNMRHDWNSLLCDDDQFRFKNYDKQFFPHADSMVEYMADFVSRFQLKMRYNTSVKLIDKQSDEYIITTETNEQIRCKVLVVATGVSKPNIPNIEGIEHSEQYQDMSLDLTDYEDKRVLIIGKKNSAFETAEHLTSAAAMIHLASPNSIKMAWKTHYVGDLRAINNNVLDTYQLKTQNAVLDADIVSIKKKSGQLEVTFKYHHAEDEIETIIYDKVLCCAGFKFDASIYSEQVKPELAHMGKYPALKPNFESVNNPNLYVAGTLTHSLDYRKATSGFIHGFRYNSKALAEILLEKFSSKPIPNVKVLAQAESITEHMLDRVNHSGGLWQQPGFIADAAVLEDGFFNYSKEFPLDYLVQRHAAKNVNLFTLTLEYGAPIMGDPFAVERIHRENTEKSEASQFLHPVVRHYVNGELQARHDIIEDLEAKWVEPEHYQPLIAFFNQCLTASKKTEKQAEMA